MTVTETATVTATVKSFIVLVPVGAEHPPEVKLVLGLGRGPSDRVENAVVGSNPVPKKFTVCQN